MKLVVIAGATATGKSALSVELAQAIDEDPNFASTLTTLAGEKVAKAGDTMTVTASLISFPAGNTVQPAWSSISVVSTE